MISLVIDVKAACISTRRDCGTMAALSGFVNKMNSVLLFNHASFRKFLPLCFFGLCFGGSVLKELDVVPESYLSNRRNLLNLYFVKLSWGWTLVLLLPFIFLSNSYNRDLFFVLKRLTSLVVATVIWYCCTETFFYIENITGSCYESDSLQIVREEFGSKATCKNAGLFWYGFDISGHCFILSYSALLIVEEMAPMQHLIQHGPDRSAVLDVLFIALNAIVIIWLFMFSCTSVYFHDTVQKFLGTLFGVLGWYVTYKVWYNNPLSPGLPPHQSEHKQHD